jgi:hypothetical protein
MNFPKILGAAKILLLGLGRDGVPTNNQYKAVINSDKERYLIRSIVRLDARGSTTTPNTDPKYYYWTIKSAPIGSHAQRFGLITKDDNAQFTPDKTGIYTIELIVGDDTANSPPVTKDIKVSIIIDSSGQQIIPDSSYLWQLLGDFYVNFN